MGGSLVVAGYFTFLHDAWGMWELAGHEKLVWGSLITTVIWLVATWLTPAESEETLQNFVRKVNPGGPGWSRWKVEGEGERWSVPRGIASMVFGSIGVYAALIATGSWLYGEMMTAGLLAALALVCTVIVLALNRSRG